MKTTIVLSLIGIVLAVASALYLRPRLGGTTVTRTVARPRQVAEQRTVTRTVTVDGKEAQVDVPETTFRSIPEMVEETVRVEPTPREKLWLYGMLGIGGFLGLFSILTAIAWFYFLIRKDGVVPQVITEMLKYLVSSFMGIFIGYMAGSSPAEGEQPDLPDAPPAAPAAK
jgi:hypothetical protein